MILKYDVFQIFINLSSLDLAHLEFDYFLMEWYKGISALDPKICRSMWLVTTYKIKPTTRIYVVKFKFDFDPQRIGTKNLTF